MATAGPLLPSWNLVRVYGTWVMPDGSAMMPGTYTVEIPGRLTNRTDDAIIPAGTFISGDLNVTAGAPSLDILIPATDDSDIEQDGWKPVITVTLRVSGTTPKSEVYVIDVPFADRPVADGGTGDGVNLRTIALASQIAPQVALYGVGIPGGLATLPASGPGVIDAQGNLITGGGGGGTGASTWSELAGIPAPLAPLTATSTQLQVRNAIGAADAATVTSLATTVAAKADSTTVNTALASKADATATTSALAAKADASALTSGLASKADAAATTTALAGKADGSAMSDALALKQDAIAVVTSLPATAGAPKFFVLITDTATP